ncbi:putative F-box associated interaction domain-containing protein [Helianthus annuus]|nr:putative F-box associated interaction domain-containing protein [Helianthus annuus]
MDFETGEYGPHSILPFPFQGEKKEVWILANLDGLLCVCLSQTHELLLWNPTTASYRHLATPAGHGVYEDNADTVGLYSDPSNDYNLLHLTRRSGVLAAHIYSRQQGNWRKIAFKTNPAYHTRKFYWSPATLCAGTLYFTICKCWVVGRNVVIGFDTSTEQVTEISFPHVPFSGIFQAGDGDQFPTCSILRDFPRGLSYGAELSSHGSLDWPRIHVAFTLGPTRTALG